MGITRSELDRVQLSQSLKGVLLVPLVLVLGNEDDIEIKDQKEYNSISPKFIH